MEDFIQRISGFSVSELEKEIDAFELHCLNCLETYKTCKSEECRAMIRNHIEFYEERIQVLKEFLEYKLSGTE